MLTKPDDVADIFTATHSSRAIHAHHGESGGCLEDVPRDNDGHQRSTAVNPSGGMTSNNDVTSIA
jgi:hypothetical protein